MKIASKISDLSSAFSKNIRQNLTADELTRVTKANKLNTGSVCATHDFLDSNICMADAFYELNNRPLAPQSQEDLDLVSKAWEVSKEKGFQN